MDGSNQIFIVLPIVAVVILLVLVGLPFLGDRQENRGRRSGAGHPPGPGIQGQVPERSIAPDASRSDVTGPDHA
jgi:hypothetical protein